MVAKTRKLQQNERQKERKRQKQGMNDVQLLRHELLDLEFSERQQFQHRKNCQAQAGDEEQERKRKKNELDKVNCHFA